MNKFESINTKKYVKAEMYTRLDNFKRVSNQDIAFFHMEQLLRLFFIVDCTCPAKFLELCHKSATAYARIAVKVHLDAICLCSTTAVG